MTKTGKRVVLGTIGGIVLLSIVAFVLLLWRSNRQGDVNNEDVILKLAKQAEAEDNPAAAALFYGRLVQLNQFKTEYKDAHYHALVRARDFQVLAAYTNERPVATTFTPQEWEFENELAKGWQLELRGSNEQALVVFEQATNLNYYAATPELVDCNLRLGRLAEALRIIRGYTAKFQVPRFVIMGAELCALASRGDLVPEFAERFPASGRPGMIFRLYCDALIAWTKGDGKSAYAQFKEVRSEIKTPLSRMLLLDGACAGDDAQEVQLAWIELMAQPPFLDFPQRGKLAVKSFIARHFPDKLPIADLGMLADELLKLDEPDLEVLRVALISRLAKKTLLPSHLDAADRAFPGDKGLAMIRAQYERALQSKDEK